MEHDDQEWLDVLSGLKPADTDSATRKEAEALRRAIAADSLRQNEARDQISVRRMRNELIVRLRREGLLDSKPASINKSLTAFAAVAVLALIYLLGYWHTKRFAPPVPGMSDDFPVHLVTRAELEVQRLLVESPDHEAARLVRESGTLGLSWRLSRVGDDWLLEVYVGLAPTGEIALFHALGALPEPEGTRRFC